MAIDPSIYGQLKTAQTNPMEMMGNVQALIGQMNQNRLFQAKQAAGQQVQQAIGPDGHLDENALMRGVAGDPRAALAAGETATESLGRQVQHVQITGQQLDQAVKKASALSAATQGLLSNPNAGPADAARSLGALVTSNILTPQEAISEAQNIPQAPDEFQKWLHDHAVNFMSEEGRLRMVGRGQPTPFATPQGTYILSVSPDPAIPARQIGMIPHGLSPGEAATPAYTTMSPTGQPGVVLKGDLAGGAQPGFVPAGASGAPGAPAGLQSGRPMAAPGQAIPSPPSRITGPPAGVLQAAEAAGSVSGQGNANMAMQLQQRAAKVPDNKAILGNLDGLLESFQPGPQSGFWKKFGQIGAEYGVKIPGAPPADKVAAQEEFGKLAFQLAQSQFQALGGTGTDSKLDSTMHTSPSELLTRYGNKGIIALLKGNEDAVAAQNDAWQKWQGAGHGAGTYGQFLAQWNKVYDPRVFQSVYMSPAERQSALKGMTEAEKSKFQQDYKRAVGLGWIAP